ALEESDRCKPPEQSRVVARDNVSGHHRAEVAKTKPGDGAAKTKHASHSRSGKVSHDRRDHHHVKGFAGESVLGLCGPGQNVRQITEMLQMPKHECPMRR